MSNRVRILFFPLFLHMFLFYFYFFVGVEPLLVWRILYYIGAVFPLVAIVTAFLMPESAIWYERHFR